MENICRTCLRSPENMLLLYDHPELLNKIEAISSIKILIGTGFPSTICEECFKNVNTMYNFRKVIINNDKELRERRETLQKAKPQEEFVKVEEFVTDEQDIDYEHENDLKEEQQGEEHNDTEDPLDDLNKMKYKCNICDKAFSAKFKMKNHRRTHEAPGICSICGLVVRADNLRRHVMLHSEVPVECIVCGKLFKNSESLRGHKQMHKGIIYTCDECGRTFKIKSEYKRHLKFHLDPDGRKQMCSICGKKVKCMKRHMQSHTGERPYPCTYCKKGFTSTYALKVHTRQHTNEKPYICEYCPMTFPQKVSLDTHIKAKHMKT